MLTQIGNRPSTKDIDVLLENIPDPSLSLISPAAKRCAYRRCPARTPINWINDVIGDALRNYGPLPTGTIWRVYGPLEVLVPERAYILALKLLAHRAQDEADIRILCHEVGVSTRDEARRILDTYITDDQIKQVSQVDAALAQLLP